MNEQTTYEKDLYIDCDALDIEWLMQPMLMVKYVEMQASTGRELDRVKEKLNLIRAELDRDIRKDPKDFKIAEDIKITEAVIAGCILEQKKYKNATTEVIDAQYEFNTARGTVQAVDQRKQALENLVKLHGQHYFAGPKIPRDLSSEVEQSKARKESNAKIKIRRRT